MYFTMYVLCDKSVFGPMQYATVKFPLFGSCIEKSCFVLFLIFFFCLRHYIIIYQPLLLSAHSSPSTPPPLAGYLCWIRREAFLTAN